MRYIHIVNILIRIIAMNFQTKYIEWNTRIKILGITKQKFCELANIPYSTYLHMTNNSALHLLFTIDAALEVLERERKKTTIKFAKLK